MKLTEEQQEQILNEYLNTDKPVKAIAIEYGVDTSTVSHTVKRLGGELRRPKKPRNGAKKCFSCKAIIKLDGTKKARFCPFCGADIRDEREIVLEKANKLFSLAGFLPETARDEAQETIRAICSYLENDKAVRK